MRTILHIGTQKTGSKAIQAFLANHAGGLADAGVCFPRAGREGGWHQPICHDLRRGDGSSLVRALEEAAACHAEVVVLSCETFYRLPTPALELLRSVVHDPRIVLFLRRQDHLIDSMYNQLIKAHRFGFTEIEAFEAQIGGLLPDFDHLATVERWAAVFGPSGLLPIVYAKTECAVGTFLERAGIAVQPGWRLREDSNPNPALDATGLAILRLAKKFLVRDDDLPRLVEAARLVLRERFIDTYRRGDCAVLSPGQRQAILDRYRHSNERVRQMFFPHVASLFLPPRPDDEPAGSASSRAVADLPVDLGIVEAIYRQAGLAFVRPR